jgi:hypothetical protein
MNKKEKVQKILAYLGSNGDDWISADSSPSGKIVYTVNGMQEKIYTYTNSNLTESYREVAKAVVNSGFDFGSCKKIFNDEQAEKHRSKKLDNFMIEGFNAAEKFRVSRLSESEKIIDIYEKYNIKVTEYEISED